MSGITRSDLYVSSIKVEHTPNNVLEMDLQGNLIINTKSVNSNIKENLELNSIKNMSLTTLNGDLMVNSQNGSVILRNGKYINDESLEYIYGDPDVDDNDNPTDYFQNNLIIKPYTNKKDVVELRNGSLLIESLGTKKLTLYSNNGINNVAHGNITSVTDENYIVQANKKINLTSLGFITFNSERFISSIEEDISLFSSTGNIIIGGNGITNNGIRVNNNDNNNFIGIGKSGTAQRSLDIEINNPSNNTHKNGLLISNTTNSKNTNQELLNPEIELRNSTTNIKVNMGIGRDSQDINLRVICKKVAIGNKTYLVSLNSFNFTQNDVGNKITWNNYPDNSTNTILNILNDTTTRTGYTNGYGIIAEINNESSLQISTFSYQIGYIYRNNFAYLKTKTSSDLVLGTNNKNILNITSEGNIGINTELPNGTFNVKNNYGELFNNKVNKSKTYFYSKSIQFRNGNILVVSNSLLSSNYNLEGFIYNDNNQLLYNFTILDNSPVEIMFNLDNLINSNDLFVICYCYKKNDSYVTKDNIYTNTGLKYNDISTTFIEHHHGFQQSSYPNIKSFNFTTGSLNFSGYVLVYNDIVSISKVNTFIQIYKTELSATIFSANSISLNILGEKYDITKDLFPAGTGTTSKLNNNIEVDKIYSRENKYIGLEVNNLNNTLIITNSNKIINVSKTYYHSYLQMFELSKSNSVYSITVKKFGSDLYLPIKIESYHTSGDLDGYESYRIDGVNIKLIKNNPNDKKYILTFYDKNINNNNNNGIYTKNITLNIDFSSISNSSSPAQKFSESTSNNLLTDIPSISYKEEGKYLLGWINRNNIYYFEKDLDVSTTTIKQVNTGTAEQIFILCTNDLSGIYKETVLMWNNKDTIDILNNNSITLKKILSSFNIFSVKNENMDFKLTNSGQLNIINSDKINLNESIEIDKTNSKVTILKNLIISESSALPNNDLPGVNGQLNYYAVRDQSGTKTRNSNLYIFLGDVDGEGGEWKKITTS